MQGGIESKKLQRDMKPRDAVLSFECFSPDMVQVSETTVLGGSVHHRETQRHPNTVTQMEEKYMFFANQADLARRQVMHGHSCKFSVYFREP
jgi:hypothetical protein